MIHFCSSVHFLVLKYENIRKINFLCLILGVVHKRRKSAEKGHFIPFFSILKGAEGRRGFNSAISYITTVISTCIIHKHRDFDLSFSSIFEKVVTFSKLELTNKSKSVWLFIKEVEITVVIYKINELNPLRLALVATAYFKKINISFE